VSLGLSYRLVAGIPTLITEGLLVKIDIILVGAKEVVVTVKLHGVCHVVRHEVIESAQSSGKPGFV
jgi:hypothetical protein